MFLLNRRKMLNKIYLNRDKIFKLFFRIIMIKIVEVQSWRDEQKKKKKVENTAVINRDR